MITVWKVLEKVKYAGSALYHHIAKGTNMTNIGIYSSNRPEVCVKIILFDWISKLRHAQI